MDSRLPPLFNAMCSVLASCVFPSESDSLKSILSALKISNRLDGRTDASLLDDARRMLEAHDTGPIHNLGIEYARRSPEMHDPAYREALSASISAAAAAGGAAATPAGSSAKRKRADSTIRNSDATPPSSSSSSLSADSVVAPAASNDGACSLVPAVAAAASSETPSPLPESSYKHALQLFSAAFLDPPGLYAAARLRSARRVFDDMESALKLAPNARSFVLMMYAAVQAGDSDYAGATLRRMMDSGIASLDTLYLYMQPAFIDRLVRAGVLADSPQLLAAEPNSDKWCFLTAAAEAAMGDQYGSKHGAVLTLNGVCVSKGHNHRFAPRGACVYTCACVCVCLLQLIIST